MLRPTGRPETRRSPERALYSTQLSAPSRSRHRDTGQPGESRSLADPAGSLWTLVTDFM
jgi:hypothetical protein